jgi:hypothetical protein
MGQSLNLLESVWESDFPEDQGIKDGKNVLAIGQNASHRTLVNGIVVGQALPSGQNVGGHVDIFPQFLQRMTAQEKAIEECRLILRFREAVVGPLHRASSFKEEILSLINYGALEILCSGGGFAKHNLELFVKSYSVSMRVCGK